jgi:hypothetical protein
MFTLLPEEFHRQGAIFLRNTYTEKRTLDFHVTQIFGAREFKNENISECNQNIQTLSLKFVEAALQD